MSETLSGRHISHAICTAMNALRGARLQRTGDLVELRLKGGREAVVHEVREVSLQERGQHAAQALRMQRLALLADVIAVLRPASRTFSWQVCSQPGSQGIRWSIATAGTAELWRTQVEMDQHRMPAQCLGVKQIMS